MKSGDARTILQQGHMDSFCLPYAVLNAFKSITCPEEDAYKFTDKLGTAWSKMINITPSLQNFAGKGSVLTGIHKKLDLQAKENLMNQYVQILLQATSNTVSKGLRMEVTRVGMGKGQISEWQNRLLAEPFPEKKAYIICFNRKQDPNPLRYEIEGKHWVTIVGARGKSLCVACSYTSHHRGNNYREYAVTGQTPGRFFNNEASGLSEENIDKDYVFELSLL